MAADFTLSVVAPDRSVVEEQVTSVVAPGTEGYFGVMAGHVPLIAALKPGIVEYLDSHNQRHFIYAGGGFAEITPSHVTILADEAARAGDIDVSDAEKRLDEARSAAGADGFVEVCAVDQIPENRAVVVSLSGERVAVFRYDGNVSAISNVCRHQNGPLGEGRIIDGCVTCPWHGYQYLPGTGASPPPFTEKVPTYRTQVIDGKVLIHPCAHAPGTPIEPARIDQAERIQA